MLPCGNSAALHDHLKNFSRLRFALRLYFVECLSTPELSFLLAPGVAPIAVSPGWDCKGRSFFRIRKIYFEIIFAAPFRLPVPASCRLRCRPSFPSFQWRFRRPSLAEWCKDRDICTLLPRPRHNIFCRMTVTRYAIER